VQAQVVVPFITICVAVFGVGLWNCCHCRTSDWCQAKGVMELLGQSPWISDSLAFLFPRGKHVRPMMECVGHQEIGKGTREPGVHSTKEK
jgi:hypothetical protein